MSTTNEPDLTPLLAAIKLLVTSEGTNKASLADWVDLTTPFD